MNAPSLAADCYLCPGETQPISRAVHLGRLTASYPACRECEHRVELTPLSLLQRRRVEQSLSERETTAHFDAEGLTGKAGSQLTPPVARSAAVAFARSLGDQPLTAPTRAASPAEKQDECLRGPNSQSDAPGTSPQFSICNLQFSICNSPPLTPALSQREREDGESHCDFARDESNARTVLLGNDGRADSAALLAAVADGLRCSGAKVVDAGVVTASCLALGVNRSLALGGIYIGNPSGEAHQLGLRFWQAGGRPVSHGAGLDEIEAAMRSPPSRSGRRFAPIARGTLAGDYLALLAPYYHALRPLRIVVDSHCLPLVGAVQKLTAQVGCRITLGRDASGRVAECQTVSERATSWLQRRWRVLARQVVNEQAHFGLWVDGAGEACHWIDECGQAVPDGMLARLIAGQIGNLSHEALTPAISQGEWEQTSSRAAMFAKMRERHSPQPSPNVKGSLGGLVADDGRGRIWFGGAALPRIDDETPSPLLRCPVPDALVALTWLLVILSRSDRPLSRVLEIG